MYIEIGNDLICIDNSDIILIDCTIVKHYLNKEYTIRNCATKTEAIKIINIIKKGIINKQQIIKIPTKEELERWSE